MQEKTVKKLVDIPEKHIPDMKEAAKKLGQSVKSFIEVAAIEKAQKIKKSNPSK